MSGKFVSFTLLVSVVASLLIRGISVSRLESREDRVTNEICALNANHLETGGLRDAYEGIRFGLLQSRMGEACVSIVDNGRSFSPDCLKPNENYRTIVCKAEANTGVRAQISHPSNSLIGWPLLFLFAALTAVAILGRVILRTSVESLANRIAAEIQRRLVPTASTGGPRGRIEQLVEFLLEITGLSSIVQQQINDLHRVIATAEQKAIHEAALRAKHETEASKAKDYIEKVRQIRHDIRSPLAALIAAKSVGTSDDGLQKTLSSSIASIEKMIEDLHRLEASEAIPRLAIVEVILEEEVASLRPRFANGKKAKLFLDYDGQALSPVTVVTDLFRRVIRNLIDNAYDAISAEGEIRISVSSNGGNCRISIKDNGSGVSPDAIPHLFSQGATFNKVGGTGLGLFYAQQTVQAWRGSIEFYPLVGGSRFDIVLPVTQVGVTFVGLPESPELWIVDDRPEVAEQLRRAGFEIERTAVGREDGITLLNDSRESTAMVLLDQNLESGCLGTDLADEARIGPNVYLCTDAYDDAATLGRARRRSLRVLPKPLCFLAAPGLA